MMRINRILIILCAFSVPSFAGVMPSQSRVIYGGMDKNKSLMLANTNEYPVIVQTWVDRGEATPDSADIPFVTIPPVFRLEASGIKGIQIIYNQAMLPQDKESLFWFNIYEIPPERKNTNPENSVLVTMNTQIKLFYRPENIKITPDEAIKKVSCRAGENFTLFCSNPTPVYISVTGVQLTMEAGTARDTVTQELMMPPLSETSYKFSRNHPISGNVIFFYIDDAGNRQEYIIKKIITY